MQNRTIKDNGEPLNFWKEDVPVYARMALFFIAVVGLFYLLYIGQEIILPILFSGLFAMLLNPVVVFLVGKKIPRIPAIAIAILAGFILFSTLIIFICMQIGMFTERLPDLEERLSSLVREGAVWTSQTFDIKLAKINLWILKAKMELMSNSNAIIGATLSTITGTLILVFLIPIYVFMMLYYEPLFVEFIRRAFPRENHAAVKEIILESKAALQHYLMGLLLESVIVAVMNAVGLLIIGVEYAVLWGILGAILNIIPYIGGVVAVALPMLMALVTNDSYSTLLLIALLYAVVQFIDNNIIVPRVVASRVQINALVSVIVVIFGGALWGVPGMFLSIPLIAVVKIVCDRITFLKPFGFLLGDCMPKSSITFFRKKKPVSF